METPDSLPFPESILLASDLGHRCDRPLDRAITCARAWGSTVDIAVVREYGVPAGSTPQPDAGTLLRELREELQADDVRMQLHLAEGDPAVQVVDLAAARKSGLVVTGIARSSPLAGILLGRTVDRVLLRAPAPVLVVRRRGRIPYRRIIVATDLEAPSRLALHVALRWFPDTPVRLFHAYRPPMSTGSEPDEARAEMHAGAVAGCQAFLAASGLSRADDARITVQAEYGEPELLLADCGRRLGADLLVLGNHGRGALFETLIGSTARRLLEQVDTDVLVVRRAGT